ncbi:MAG: enoyl-CoA hydratase-related protein [Chloroflexota bacterium]|nr:enoyl-CoA hydratase-related protein [Chloroflexota bacterium]
MYARVETRFETIVVERAGSVVYLTMDRPEARNAMNFRMVQEVRDFFVSIRDDRSVRCVVLRGAGGTFSAGADIKEMCDPANRTRAAQLAYAEVLDEMLVAVQRAPQVTVAVVEGAALGGGLGLICVADVAVAAHDAVMALPEVRLGIAPAVISPFVLQRIGLTHTRQLALTGRRLSGFAAQEIGLVHDVALEGQMDEIVEGYVGDILEGAPEALAATKALLFYVADRVLEESRAYRVDMLCRLQESPEGREGMDAFAAKRKPAWVPHQDPFAV